MEKQQAIDILDQNGKMRFGRYNQPAKSIDLINADVYTGKTTPKLFKDLRLKEWHAYQAGNEKWFIFVAIMNLKTASAFQVLVYDKQYNALHRFSKIRPLHRVDLSKNLLNDSVFFSDEELLIAIDHGLEFDRIQLSVKVKGNKNRPPIAFNFNAHARGHQPEVNVIPLPNNCGMYAHKQLMPMDGVMTIGERVVRFKKEDSFVIVDDQKAFYPYHMKWNWVTGAGFTDGKLSGFNLTVNDSTEPDKYNENGFWVEGKFYPLPAVQFTVNQKNVWRIMDRDGDVDLHFHPLTENERHENWVLARTDYSGPFGYYEGILISGDKELIVNGLFGMGEKMSIHG